jgi:hypothetical protein
VGDEFARHGKNRTVVSRQLPTMRTARRTASSRAKTRVFRAFSSMRYDVHMKRAHLLVGVLGIFAIAGAASWARGDLIAARSTPAAPGAAATAPAPAALSRGYVRATLHGHEMCARASTDSAATRTGISLDCDARDLEVVDIQPAGTSCGKLVAQDRIEPFATCKDARGWIANAQRDGARWVTGSCSCGDVTVTFDVPVR